MGEENQKSIMIGFPTKGVVCADTAISLASVVASATVPMAISSPRGSYVHTARNQMALEAVERGHSHLMFIDDDIEFPAHTVNQLLEQDLDIVAAVYNLRQDPPRSLIKIADRETHEYVLETEFPKETFCETPQGYVAAMPTGCMLIKTSIFKKLEFPYFWYGKPELVEGGFNSGMGEDVWFCTQARKAGYKIWCDPTISVKHIGLKKF